MRGLFQRWLDARLPRGAEVRLTHRSVYIIPTRYGLLYAVLLGVLLTGSINYVINLGYALTFLLGGMGLVSILHTWRNLAGLGFSAGRSEPAFAGQAAVFHLRLEGGGLRPAIVLEVPGGASVTVAVPPGGTTVALPVAAPRRGRLALPRIKAYTRFPLGLLHAWAWLEVRAECLVYPRPEGGHPPPPPGRGETSIGGLTGAGREDFGGLRDYRPGDPPRHVAWKASARSELLLMKEFTGQAGNLWWLDWDALPGMEMEARLSRLARWVVEADRGGHTYGLRLPGREIAPAQGEEQRQRCLAALALFGLEDDDGR